VKGTRAGPASRTFRDSPGRMAACGARGVAYSYSRRASGGRGVQGEERRCPPCLPHPAELLDVGDFGHARFTLGAPGNGPVPVLCPQAAAGLGSGYGFASWSATATPVVTAAARQPWSITSSAWHRAGPMTRGTLPPPVGDATSASGGNRRESVEGDSRPWNSAITSFRTRCRTPAPSYAHRLSCIRV